MSTKKTPITEAQQDRADLQIRALQKEISYDLRDFTVEFIVKKFEKGEFFIPDYQRKYVWPDRNKNRFVESLLLGLPIPFMFVVDNPEGLLEIVDGAQRIQSLEQFVNNDLRLAGLEKLTEVNGFTFDDLPLFQRRKFLNRSLRLIVLEESTKIEVRQELFDRVNTGSMKAKEASLGGAHFKGISWMRSKSSRSCRSLYAYALSVFVASSTGNRRNFCFAFSRIRTATSPLSTTWRSS